MTPVALVTGAAGGIGVGIVRRLVAAGFQVIGADRVAGPDLPGVRWCSVDLRHPGSVDAAVADAAATGALVALVCCAGVLGAARLDEVEDETLASVVDINLVGTVRTCRAALPHLREGASIVIIGSISAARGGAPGVSVYAATKAALEGLNRALACELGPRRIRVNVVSPGYIRAPMSGLMTAGEDGEARLARRVPLGRLGEPEDVAEAVEFLLSDRSSYISGTVITVDGGVCAL